MTAKTDATCTGPGPLKRWLTRRGDADVLEMLGLAS